MHFNVPSFGLVLWLCLSAGIASQENEVKEVSIMEMVGPDPKQISFSTDFNQNYTAPEPEQVHFPDGMGVGAPFGCNGPDDCDCQPKRFNSIRWNTQSTSKISGQVQRISETLCPPGTIGKSFTYSYSYQINVNAGPDLKVPIVPFLDKFGIRAGFSYTWGRAQTTAYTVQCNDPKNGHPCVEIFTPDIGIISGIAYETVEVPGDKICSRGPDSQMTIHVPIVDSPDCSGKGNTCGAAGVYDSCYYIGDRAKQACPRSNLGPTPNDHVCPADLQ